MDNGLRAILILRKLFVSVWLLAKGACMLLFTVVKADGITKSYLHTGDFRAAGWSLVCITVVD